MTPRHHTQIQRWRTSALATVLALGLAGIQAAQALATSPPASRFEQALSTIAERGVDTAVWRRWIGQEATALRHWTNQTRDNPAWVGGWPHDHADATTGRHLPWGPNTPRPSEALRNGKVTAGWTAINREHNLRQILRAARLAYWQGRPELVLWAGQELDGYARLYGTQPVRGLRDRSVLFTESLQEATVLPGLLEAIRLLTPHVPPEQSARWRDDLVTPLVQHLMASQHEVSNKSVWRTVGVALAAQQYGRKAWQQWASTGVWSFQNQMATALSADGFWFELSLQYQAYVLRALAEYAIGMQGMSAPADLHAQGALQRMAQAVFSQRYPNGQAPLINDSQPGRKMPTRDLHDLLLQAWPAMPAKLAYLQATVAQPEPSWAGWTTLLAAPTEPSEPGRSWPEAAAGAQTLPGLRSVQWLQGPWRGLLRAGQAAPYHAHQDALSVELMFHDTWVWRNPGTQSYGSSMHRHYFRKAAAHSGPLVSDGGATQWFARPAPASAPSLSGPDGAAEARQPSSASASFHGFQHRTRVSRSLSGSTAELTDTLNFVSTGPPVDHGAVFHTPCRVHPTAVTTRAASSEAAPQTPAREALSYLKLSYWGTVESEWQVNLYCGAQRLQAVFTSTAPAEVWLGGSPGGPTGGPARTSIYLRMPQSGTTRLRVQLTPLAGTP